MPRGLNVTGAAAAVSVAATIAVFAALQWRAAETIADAAFWYENVTFALPEDAIAEIGGPLSPAEIETIKIVSRRELERAFAGLAVTLTDDPRSFWRIAVVQQLARQGPLPHTGEAYSLGPLGGRAALSFERIALNGIKHAPEGATRSQVVAGIGRGIGNSAAHEFAHFLGATAHNREDENSYEYLNSDRASQYYGELHWTTAWPLLQEKLGRGESR